MSDAERFRLIAKLKASSQLIKTEPEPDNKNGILLASFVVSYRLAKAQKCLLDGEFFKSTCIDMLQCFDKKGVEMSKIIEQIPLSRRTVTRRINEISQQLKQNLQQKINKCVYYSLAVDESTDINDVAQVLIFIKFIDADFNVEEDILNLVPLYGTTTGEDLFTAIEISVNEIGGFEKLCGMCTDGARSMRGEIKGLKGQFKQRGIDVPFYHCLIHQEALCAKAINLTESMDCVVKMINKIRGGHNALTHRKFQSLLQELKAQYGDLKLFTEVRWLSRGKCLDRFFSLRKEVLYFLKHHVKKSEQLVAKLEDAKFLSEIAFLTDITSYLNILNSQLQTPKQSMVTMLSRIDGFKKKMSLLENHLKRNSLSHFPRCQELLTEYPTLRFSSYSENIKELRELFEQRFTDFDDIKKLIKIFVSAKQIDIEEQDPKFQMELCDLQSDLHLMSVTECGTEFWKKVSIEEYPLLKGSILKLEACFASTHVCECAFSHIKAIKTVYRNRLTDINLSDLLRIAISNDTIDFDKLINEYN